jgi:hypothetical protein
MSWHFSFSAKTRAEAAQLLAKNVADNRAHCPEEQILPAGDRLIELMPREPARPIIVTSYGHIDQNGGNALIEVRIAPGS